MRRDLCRGRRPLQLRANRCDFARDTAGAWAILRGFARAGCGFARAPRSPDIDRRQPEFRRSRRENHRRAIWILAKPRLCPISGARYPISFILILYPISGLFLKTPDIGGFPISDLSRYRIFPVKFPISRKLRYRGNSDIEYSRYRGKSDNGGQEITPDIGSYKDIGSPDIGVSPMSEFLLSNQMFLFQPRASRLSNHRSRQDLAFLLLLSVQARSGSHNEVH